MKLTEVGNPTPSKQKRLGRSSNSFDLKNSTALSEMWHTFPGDDINCQTLKKNTTNFGSPKTCSSVTAECLSWSQAILLDSKILWVDLTTKFHFLSRQTITRRRKKVGVDSWKCPICCCILGFPGIKGLHSAFWNCLAESWNTNMTRIRNGEKCRALVFFTLAGSRRKTFITTLFCSDKVSLFIQSGTDNPWMKHCGAEWERERGRRRRDAGQRENTRKQLDFSIACVCPSIG